MALLRGVASLKWRYCHSDLLRHSAVLCASIAVFKRVSDRALTLVHGDSTVVDVLASVLSRGAVVLGVGLLCCNNGTAQEETKG